MPRLLPQIIEFLWHWFWGDRSSRLESLFRIRHASREFWEVTVIYARPHIIGAIASVAIVALLAYSAYPDEFAAGAGLGAITGSVVATVDYIFWKG